ncbi:hypothetical protein RHGRI_024849 [Rhododendron griersonianum]|uniref:Uncharacterized protein n=1 Tax=Rhododendron griersonianum TaxID=479676 RepID=A0AAV6JC91_9ERIC|nr:hypothetical protein RHGRI_024849 [Rhododendron griersonianum]
MLVALVISVTNNSTHSAPFSGTLSWAERFAGGAVSPSVVAVPANSHRPGGPCWGRELEADRAEPGARIEPERWKKSTGASSKEETTIPIAAKKGGLRRKISCRTQLQTLFNSLPILSSVAKLRCIFLRSNLPQFCSRFDSIRFHNCSWRIHRSDNKG